jgi:high-affinity iron transporter
MDITTTLPVFFITLREGVEAALVVGIVLACLGKAQASHLNRAVYQGIGAGVGTSILAGWLVGIGFRALGLSQWIYAPALKQALQGTIAAIAIALLSWMLIWMTQQAKGLKTAVERSVQAALTQTAPAQTAPAQTALTQAALAQTAPTQTALAEPGETHQPLAGNTSWGIFSLVFIAVLREGIETVLFIGAQLQQGWLPAIGAGAGLLGATGIGLLIFKGGVRINLRLFFQVMGIILLLIVGGLVVTALRKAEAAALLLSQIDPAFAPLCSAERASCLLGGSVWDLSAVLPDRKFPGILLKALLGYTQNLYWAQAIAYSAFMAIVGTRYWQSLGGGRSVPKQEGQN